MLVSNNSRLLVLMSIFKRACKTSGTTSCSAASGTNACKASCEPADRCCKVNTSAFLSLPTRASTESTSLPAIRCLISASSSWSFKLTSNRAGLSNCSNSPNCVFSKRSTHLTNSYPFEKWRFRCSTWSRFAFSNCNTSYSVEPFKAPRILPGVVNSTNEDTTAVAAVVSGDLFARSAFTVGTAFPKFTKSFWISLRWMSGVNITLYDDAGAVEVLETNLAWFVPAALSYALCARVEFVIVVRVVWVWLFEGLLNAPGTFRKINSSRSSSLSPSSPSSTSSEAARSAPVWSGNGLGPLRGEILIGCGSYAASSIGGVAILGIVGSSICVGTGDRTSSASASSPMSVCGYGAPSAFSAGPSATSVNG